MKGKADSPKIFISYSWTSPQHEHWVLDFAEKLSTDGIYVKLDKWDLKAGHDKYAFMEQMVTDKEIDQVLIICDKGYQEKANSRTGGVGTETQIISEKIYKDVGQEKFIPIIKEYDEHGEACVPAFIATRIYIDLSSDEIYESNYEELIRRLYNKPLTKRPAIGTPPAFILADEPIILKTSHKVAAIKNAVMNENKNASGLIQDYLDSFLLALDDFKLEESNDLPLDERVIESIEQMLPLRDDFISFIITIAKYQNQIDIEKIHSFLESLVAFCKDDNKIFDNYKFFIYELLLYFISILLKHKRYVEIAGIVNGKYFSRNNYTGGLDPEDIGVFNNYISSLEEARKQRLKLNRVSIVADLLRARAQHKDIQFGKIIEADLFLFYQTELTAFCGFQWFPRSTVYASHGFRLDLFDRLVSLQHFNKVRSIFKVMNIEELKSKITQYVQKRNSSNRYKGLWGYEIPRLEEIIAIDQIGKLE